MKSPVVLAYAGGIHASAAIPWLADTLGVEVVTVTLDMGQGHELAELRARALACGAVRAHAVDAREGFARDVLVPSLFTSEPAEKARSPAPETTTARTSPGAAASSVASAASSSVSSSSVIRFMGGLSSSRCATCPSSRLTRPVIVPPELAPDAIEHVVDVIARFHNGIRATA